MICVRCGANTDDGLMRTCIVYRKRSTREYYKHRYKTGKVVRIMAKGKSPKKEVKKAPKFEKKMAKTMAKKGMVGVAGKMMK